MKIVLAQQNYHIGNFEANTQKIITAILHAKEQKADLIVFSELCVCGYPPRDFLEFDDFLSRCMKAIDDIKQYTSDIAVLIGSPSRNPVRDGKDLHNSIFFLHQKEIKQIVHKTLLPTYDVFDEYRYFEPAYSWHCIPFLNKKIAVTVCEDIWNLGDNPLYRICPMDELMKEKPDVMINLSASPFDYTHAEERKAIIQANVRKYHLPMLYCNAVGSQTEIVFDGGSIVMNKDGQVIQEGLFFEEDYLVATFNDDHTIEGISNSNKDDVSVNEMILTYQPEKNIDRIYNALVLGIRDYFRKMNFKKAILGSSGGIDSAVTLAIACEALAPENVRAVLMPSQYSSSHSISDAEALSNNLGNEYEILPIEPVFNAFMNSLHPVFKNLPFGLAEENIQARTRGNLLMAIANKFGLILLNTTNKSECATGYGTLYGDMAGGLSVLGDVYKMQVYALAKYINRNREIIPTNIILKAPSAELRPNQKDSDSLPDYDTLDAILFQYIERRQGPKEIVSLGFDEEVVARTLKLVNNSEYKRNQFCPIIRVSPKAFGVGRRLPIVAKYLS